MKALRFLPITICVFIFLSVLGISAFNQPENKKANITKNIATSTDDSGAVPVINLDTNNNDEEMRGVWVTYMDLNLEDNKRTEKDFTDKFTEIADNCKESGFNTLIVQVRPFCDALYKSEYFPSSHIITGIQGANLDYDPLEIMCNICKEKNLKIHAWVNPYRVKTKETPKTLSDDNPYIKNKDLAVETESGIYFNPALQEVRDLIVNGVCEIVENYNVDGIQFDDYFYPTNDESFDKTEYEEYKDSVDNPMELSEWRKANVNIMVAQCYMALHKIDNDIAFGISPQGNLGNNEGLCADVKTWCKEVGYVDYICPQVYFSLDNPALEFEEAMNEWLDIEYSGFCDLYIGLAGYKAGDEESDSGTWKDKNDILKKEVELIRQNSKIRGFMLYAYDSLINEQSKEEIENVIKLLN